MADPDLHLNSTAGSLFIGVLFSLIFFSCTVAQTVFYYLTYRDDSLRLKALVAFLSALDLITLVLNIEYLRELVVSHHADPAALCTLPKFWIPEFFLASLTFLVVQLFFIHKIWALLENRRFQLPLTLVAISIALVSFAGGVGVVYGSSLKLSTDWILAHVKIPASVQQIMAVVTDIYITVSLCVIFRSSQASFKATQTLLNQLTVYAINRGTLTATIQFLHFATYLATYRHFSFIWMVFHIPGSKVYVNAVLAALNIRCKLRDLGSLSDQSSLRFVDSEDFSSQFLALQPLPSSQSVTASATV